MSTQVQNRPKNDIPGHGPDALHDHDLTNVNKNLQHREALRLALGSILTPKRSYSPPSRSHSRPSSGTASPTLSFSFPSTSPSPPSINSPSHPHPPHPTPGHPHGWLAESHLQPLFMHPHSHHSHPHTPSRLGITDSTSTDYLSPQSRSSSGSPTTSSNNSPVISPHMNIPDPQDAFPGLPDAASEPPSKAGALTDIHAPAPIQATVPDSHAEMGYGAHREAHEKAAAAAAVGDGSETPKAKFIETLQSKSAWDALIHGSFS